MTDTVKSVLADAGDLYQELAAAGNKESRRGAAGHGALLWRAANAVYVLAEALRKQPSTRPPLPVQAFPTTGRLGSLSGASAVHVTPDDGDDEEGPTLGFPVRGPEEESGE